MTRVLTKDAKDWVATARDIAAREVKEQFWEVPDKQQIVCEILTFFPDRRRRDCMNGDKVCFDALEDIVYTDDKWVLPRHMECTVDKANPRRIMKFYVKDVD